MNVEAKCGLSSRFVSELFRKAEFDLGVIVWTQIPS